MQAKRIGGVSSFDSPWAGQGAVFDLRAALWRGEYVWSLPFVRHGSFSL